jgi:hypothetical protein
VCGSRDTISLSDQTIAVLVVMRIPNSDSAFQEVFKKLRNLMNVKEFYTEVQERCKDLDEFIAKKQGF